MESSGSSSGQIHVDAKAWKDRWGNSEPGPSGGQGSSRVAVLPNGEKVFIKILNHQAVDERRRRMYREVTALETLEHPGIPKLLETNVRKYADHAYSLYFVSEFVDGETLSERRERDEMPFAEALETTRRLAEIIAYCHGNDVIHRDIKPDNVLLGPGRRTVLVDFGMVHHDLSEDELRTMPEQALGNRFLILPELQAGSELKRDPRSDLTGVVAIFFFLLTGRYPTVLLDESGAMPHQRKGIDFADAVGSDIKSFFERGFQYEIDSRFQSAEALMDALKRLESGPSVLAETSDALLERIKTRAAEPVERANREIQQKYNAISSQIRKFTQQIVKEVGDSVYYTETGGAVDFKRGVQNLRVGFRRATRKPGTIWPAYQIEAVGTEFVVTSAFESSPALRLRVPMADPTFGPRDLEQLRTYLLRGIEAMFDD